MVQRARYHQTPELTEGTKVPTGSITDLYMVILDYKFDTLNIVSDYAAA